MEELLKKTSESFEDILKSKEMLCACYAYDYEKKKTKTSLNKFYELWNSFSLDEKRTVIQFYYSFNDYELLKCVGVENRGNEDNDIHQTIVDFIKTEYFIDEVKKNIKK